MLFDAFNAFTIDAAPGYTAHIGTRNSSLNISEYVAISIECIVEQGIKLLNTTYRISNTIGSVFDFCCRCCFVLFMFLHWNKWNEIQKINVVFGVSRKTRKQTAKSRFILTFDLKNHTVILTQCSIVLNDFVPCTDISIIICVRCLETVMYTTVIHRFISLCKCMKKWLSV